jgi:sialic acid synthase SpsE
MVDTARAGRDACFLIGEAASAHDGDFERAMRLVALASDTGWNAVKFQFWGDSDKLADRRNVPDHYREIYHRYRVPEEWLPQLRDFAEDFQLEFIVSCNMVEDIPTVAKYTSRFKVPSFEAGDTAFRRAFPVDRPLIVSTGMSSWSQTNTLIAQTPVGTTYLHCVSAYPCPLDQANVAVVRQMVNAFPGIPFGYSDHTAHSLTGALAVACGAEVVEAHIRLLDTDPENPDYACALSPPMARLYVNEVRRAEKALGSGVKRPLEVERPMMAYRVKP